jgi:hypothetical protein
MHIKELPLTILEANASRRNKMKAPFKSKSENLLFWALSTGEMFLLRDYPIIAIGFLCFNLGIVFLITRSASALRGEL